MGAAITWRPWDDMPSCVRGSAMTWRCIEDLAFGGLLRRMPFRLEYHGDRQLFPILDGGIRSSDVVN